MAALPLQPGLPAGSSRPARFPSPSTTTCPGRNSTRSEPQYTAPNDLPASLLRNARPPGRRSTLRRTVAAAPTRSWSHRAHLGQTQMSRVRPLAPKVSLRDAVALGDALDVAPLLVHEPELCAGAKGLALSLSTVSSKLTAPTLAPACTRVVVCPELEQEVAPKAALPRHEGRLDTSSLRVKMEHSNGVPHSGPPTPRRRCPRRPQRPRS